jgi:hypothetical protein
VQAPVECMAPQGLSGFESQPWRDHARFRLNRQYHYGNKDY